MRTTVRDPFDFSTPSALAAEPVAQSGAAPANAWEDALRTRFELLAPPPAGGPAPLTPEGEGLLADLLNALEQGHVRAVAPPTGTAGWTAAAWVKTALVQLAAGSPVAAQPGLLPGSERRALGWLEARPPTLRIPSGSQIRRGVFLSPGTMIMPSTVIQTGVWLGPGVRVDSHVLLGSCTQVAADAAIGPGCILAGLLLPVETLPVVLDPGVTLMGQNGIYGSVHVGAGVTFRPGTIVEQTQGLYEPATRSWLRSETTLHIPPGSELAMGFAPAESGMERLTAILLRRETMS